LRDFLRFLTENPILLVILIGWIASMIGGAVRRAAEGQQRRGGAARPPRPPAKSAEEIAAELRRMIGVEEPAKSPAELAAERAARRAQRDAELAEAERRRVERSGRPPVEADVEAERAARRQRQQAERAEAERRRQERAQAAARAEGRAPAAKPLADRQVGTLRQGLEAASDAPRFDVSRLGTLGGTARAPDAPPARAPIVRRRPAAHRRRRLDLSDPAHAFMLAEVLGPPLALRPPAGGGGPAG
jgi:hypothetical protein